ncbi:Protoglobin-domain-containing protein, partial [Crepidotus variabilis]
HIERKDLYTNLKTRVSYLQSFLGWTEADGEALQAAAPYIAPLIPTVLEVVYTKLLTYDITARAFATRSTSYEGPMDEFPALDSPQIKYRKNFLKAYLKKLVTGDSTQPEFWEYLDKVGMMHTGMGRRHPLHVDYIHMNALLGYVNDIIVTAVLENEGLDLPTKTAVVRALGKVLWIQNDLFAKWYVTDGAEYT